MGNIFKLAFAQTFAFLSCGICAERHALAEHVPTDRFPNVTLTTQDGKQVEFRDLVKDKNVIINFMYTECKGICKQTTQKLVQVQTALGDDLGRKVFIYSITIDPEQPEALKKYAQTYGAKWTFLTGKKEDLNALRRKLGMSNLDPELRRELGLPERTFAQGAGQKRHSGMIAIGIGTSGRWHKQQLIRSSPEQILQKIEELEPPQGPQK
jgi:protein SCO1/2